MLPSSKSLGLYCLFTSLPAAFALPLASTETQIHGERAVTIGPRPSLSLGDVTASFRSPTLYPVECFKSSLFPLDLTIAADCDFIIDEIILRLDDPMRVQTFGFDETADVDLSTQENRSWHYGQCLISVNSGHRTEKDRFRPVDVAMVAQSIIRRCVLESKQAHGGHANIGSREKHFFVIVGGIQPPPIHTVSNDSRLSLPSSNITKKANIPKEDIDFATLRLSPRSNNKTDLTVTDSYSLPMACNKPGMPTTGNINLNDCLAAAETILSMPDILIPQTFSTEPTGGVSVPKVIHSKNCFLTINTQARLSRSDTFSYIKVAYYASEIMRRCLLGGVVKITPGVGGFFVSLTGVDPVFMETEMKDLLNSATSGLAVADS